MDKKLIDELSKAITISILVGGQFANATEEEKEQMHKNLNKVIAKLYRKITLMKIAKKMALAEKTNDARAKKTGDKDK